MKKLFKSIMSFVLFLSDGRAIRQMANEAVDHKAMLYKLLGLADGATEDMVNERFKKAMDTTPDAATKEMKAKCNEMEASIATFKTQLAERDTTIANAATAKAGFEVKITELTSAKTSAEGAFANERQARIKLIVNQAVVDGRVTGAEVDDTIKLLANAKDFDAEVFSLDKKEKKINTTQQSTGLNNQAKGGASASTEFANDVQKRVKEFPNEGYTNSWKAVERTEKGKALITQMKQPEGIKK